MSEQGHDPHGHDPHKKAMTINAMSEEDRIAFMHRKYERKLRNLRRKKREEEGEIEDLNITPMLDMMTIILVFLIKSFSASGVSVSLTDNLVVPGSSTRLEPIEAVTVTITSTDIAVGEKKVAELEPCAVPARFTNPAAPLIITPLKEALDKEVERQKFMAKFNKEHPFEGLLSVVGDKHTCYRVLFSVLATAGQAELANYKFIVLKNDQ
jgi:biopolymer transport protein ExbD